MKEKVNQLFKDKLVLVMLVLGLLTIVAAAGAVKIHKGKQYMEESPYLNLQESAGFIAGDEAGTESPVEVAGSSNATQSAEKAEEIKSADKIVYPAGTAEPNLAELPAQAAGVSVTDSLVLDFSDASRLAWPVEGNVILGYSMDTTTFFPTLREYKCNPANLIQCDVSTPVLAPANARVLEIGSNEEIGNYVRLDLGNEYSAICGQLKEIPVVENEYLHKGDILGYIAEPTKYYSIEGNNLYFEFLHGEKPVDAMEFLE